MVPYGEDKARWIPAPHRRSISMGWDHPPYQLSSTVTLGPNVRIISMRESSLSGKPLIAGVNKGYFKCVCLPPGESLNSISLFFFMG